MTLSEYIDFNRMILDLESSGKVTRTFRRLDFDRQWTVIDAILDEAGEYGPQAMNIKRVAARAGVAVGSLYQYFGSREGLLDFAIELVVRIFGDGIQLYRTYLANLPEPPPLVEAIEAYGMGWEWFSTEKGFTRFFTRAAYVGDPLLNERVVRPIAEIMLELVTDLLKSAQSRGEVRVDIDLPATARVLHGLTLALFDPQLLPYLNVYFQVSGEGFEPERTVRAAMNMILRGIYVVQ